MGTTITFCSAIIKCAQAKKRIYSQFSKFNGPVLLVFIRERDMIFLLLKASSFFSDLSKPDEIWHLH